MSQLLRTRPATTDAMLAVFDDAATLRHALAFEAELARAEAAEGLIGTAEAEAVAALCAGSALDPAALAGEAALAGTLAIPLVARLRRALPEAAAGSLHKGATSQDVADTILVRQIREGQALLDADLARTARALAALARRHAATPAIGRTLLQDALPPALREEGMRLEAIDLLMSFESWRRLRQDQGLSIAQAKNTVLFAVNALGEAD